MQYHCGHSRGEVRQSTGVLGHLRLDNVQYIAAHGFILDMFGLEIMLFGIIGDFSQEIRDLISHNHALTHIRVHVQGTFWHHGVRVTSKRFLETSIQVHEHPVNVHAQVQSLMIRLEKQLVPVSNHIGSRRNVMIHKLFPQIGSQHVTAVPPFNPFHFQGQFQADRDLGPHTIFVSYWTNSSTVHSERRSGIVHDTLSVIRSMHHRIRQRR